MKLTWLLAGVLRRLRVQACGDLLSQILVCLRLFYSSAVWEEEEVTDIQKIWPISMMFHGSPSSLPHFPKCRHWYWLPQSWYNSLIYVVFKWMRFFYCLYFPNTYTHAYISVPIYNCFVFLFWQSLSTTMLLT